MNRLLTTLATVTALAGLAPTAWAEGLKDQPRPAARLASFHDLQKRLNDPTLRLLDARSRADYDKGHMPGAVWVDVKAASALAARPGGLTDEVAWEAWSVPLGITPDTEVLVYDGDRQLEAARLWWLLGYLGAGKVGLVDGNFPLWERQGRPVTAEVVRVDPRPLRVAFDNDRHATRGNVLEAQKVGRTPVIDARSEPEYTGTEKRSKRGGHIPGACLVEWSGLVDKDGRFLDGDALRAKLSALGVEPGRPVITHCQGGGRASVDAFALERIGHPTRNYYLGWSDWGNADETPVEAGTVSAPKPDLKAEEERIRELDRRWVAAIARKDTVAVVGFYAPDARRLPSNAPEARGRAAIAEGWKEIMALPRLSFTFEPRQIRVAASGDLAYDTGTYSLSYDGPGGRVEDRGKYVVVWEKVGGDWQAALDIDNSDLPAPGAGK